MRIKDCIRIMPRVKQRHVDPAAAGFTLIELLVVISVIALLIGLLLPALKKAKETAKRAVCLSNVRQISNGFHVYASENEGRFPPVHADVGPGGPPTLRVPRTYPGFEIDGWFGKGLLYKLEVLPDPRIFYCPAQRVELFTFRGGFVNSPIEGFIFDSYQYRLFGQIVTGTGQAEVDELRQYSLNDMKTPIALLADTFDSSVLVKSYSGVRSPDTSWAHIDPPTLNVMYSDGHAETRAEKNGFVYAHIAAPLYGSYGRFVNMFWEHLEGDSSKMERSYALPPALLN